MSKKMWFGEPEDAKTVRNAWFPEILEVPKEKANIGRLDKEAKTVRLRINGEDYQGLTPKEAFAIAIQPIFPHLKYMSKEAVGYYVEEISDMIQFDLGMRVTPIIRHFLTNLKKGKLNTVMEAVYNLLLNLEDLSVNKKGYGA